VRQGVKRGKKERRKSENSKMNEEREGDKSGGGGNGSVSYCKMIFLVFTLGSWGQEQFYQSHLPSYQDSGSVVQLIGN